MQNTNNETEVDDYSPDTKDITPNSPPLSAPTQAKPKRHQAQRACSNCKRLHARCDNERPCKRCTQNGLSGTCMDIPRKRRMSRTYTEVWETKYHNNGSTSTSSTTTTTHSVAVTNSPHVITANAWGTSPVISKTPMMIKPMMPPQPVPSLGPGMIPIMGSSPYDPNLFLTDIVNPNEDPAMLAKHVYPEFGALGPTGPLYEKQDPLVESFLYHQMHELNNIAPTTPNINSSTSTNNIHKSYSAPNPSNPTPSISDMDSHNIIGRSGMTWNSIVPQQEFAISVWKGTNTPGLNYLVECNNRFLDLVGFSLDTLKNNFPCQKLFVSKAFSSQKDWPKRTQISTAYGYKDVYLTIYPLIGDLSANKYFIVNMLELAPVPKMDPGITANLTYAPELKEMTTNMKIPTNSYDLHPNLKHDIIRTSSLL